MSDPPEFQPWIAHLTRVLGKRAVTAVASSEVTVWQLISANNRELARSASLFEGFAAARSGARATIGGIAGAVVHPVVDEQRGLQGWYVSVDDKPEMICSRWYFADRERSQAVNLALAGLPVAILTEGARAVHERATESGQLRVR